MIFLSLDIGTSAVKVSLVDDELRELESARAEYPYVLLPGAKVEIEPNALLRAVVEATGRLDAARRRDVDLVCYDTFSPSPVLMDSSGGLAYPNIITHLDRRSADQCEVVDRLLGRDRFLSITGLQPFAGGSGVMALLWIKQHEPHHLDSTHQVGHLASFLHHWLTGEWTTDLVNASMFGTYETTTQAGWSSTVIEGLGLDARWFGPVSRPGTVLGGLLPDAARALGVHAGTPVTVGTNDMAAAQVGAGNVEPGRIMNTAGSSDMVSILTDAPVVDPGYYLRNSAIPGIWQIYATTTGGFAFDWFRDQFAREVSREDFYGLLVPRALDGYADDETVTFQPYLTGDRQSLEPKAGQWDGLTLATTREQMLAAMAKAMVRVLATTVERAGSVVRLHPEIKISGGLATEPFLRLKRSTFPGFDFQVVENCSVLGNVRLAQMGAGR